jgi:hypothetical protein
MIVAVMFPWPCLVRGHDEIHRGVGLEVLRKPNGDDDKGVFREKCIATAQEKKYFFSTRETHRFFRKRKG